MNNRKTISASAFLLKMFLLFLIAQATFVFVFGSISTIRQTKTAKDKAIERINNIVDLHKTDFLNEIALEDFSSLESHVNILKKDLGVDSIRLKANKFEIMKSDDLSSTGVFLSTIFSIPPLTFNMASEFEDFSAILIVDFENHFISSIAEPMFKSFLWVFLLSLLPMLCSFFLLYGRIRSKFLIPLNRFSQALSQADESGLQAFNERIHIEEIIELEKSLTLYSRLKKEVLSANLAQQVAHDIRSPLTALDFATHDLSALDEPRRLLIRNATKRIHDIANNLLKKNQNEPMTSARPIAKKICLISTSLEMIVSEKRMQYQNHPELKIELSISTESRSAFSDHDPVELKRVISNLVNNSAEALNFAGDIQIGCEVDDSAVEIFVRDNGPGIPPHILERLGQKGVTYGKTDSISGSGLGIYHAKKTVEDWAGQFEIESPPGQGTIVKFRLPLASTPNWFVSRINLKDNSRIVIFDDDPSIHQVWENRFREIGIGDQMTVHNLSAPQELRTWIKKNSPFNSETVFLCDYELQGGQDNGLDLIEELNISNTSILVTSRFEEDAVISRCQNLGIKCLPKNLTQFVPIYVD